MIECQVTELTERRVTELVAQKIREMASLIQKEVHEAHLSALKIELADLEADPGELNEKLDRQLAFGKKIREMDQQMDASTATA